MKEGVDNLKDKLEDKMRDTANERRDRGERPVKRLRMPAMSCPKRLRTRPRRSGRAEEKLGQKVKDKTD